MTVTIADQIKCVRRELAMRQRVYAQWVAGKRMKQEESDKEMAAMQAVHDTLMEAAGEKWRPIETAPKSREEILLLWSDSGGVSPARIIAVWNDYGDGKGRWMHSSSGLKDGLELHESCKLIGWLPIPKAPQPAQGAML